MPTDQNNRRLTLRIRLQAWDEARDQDSDDTTDQSGDDILFQESDDTGDEPLFQESDEIGDDLVYQQSDESGGESWDEFSDDGLGSEAGDGPTLVDVPLNYHETTTWPAAIESYYINLFAQTVQLTKGWEENGYGIYRQPAHLLRPGHTCYPLEIPASLGRPDRQPHIPGSDNRFTVGDHADHADNDDNDDNDDDQDVNIRFSTGMAFEMWGIPDEFTCTLEEAYYYHTKWCMIEPETCQDYVDESEIMQVELFRLMDRPLSSANGLRALIHRLLKASFRAIELDICGSVTRGKIVHWVTSPKVSSGYLPLMVIFEDEDTVHRESRFCQLVRTTFEDDENAAVRQIGGERLTFNNIVQRMRPPVPLDSLI